MTAQFPNVPQVPGVPAVNRAPDRILAALGGAESTLRAAQSALGLLDVNDPIAAAGAFGTAQAAATGALGQISDVFSAGAQPLVSLSMAGGAATGAINALGAGDLTGAILGGKQAVDSAKAAIGQLSQALNPVPEVPLDPGGADVQADLAQQWGLFTQGGEAAILVDNVLAIEVAQDARISDYPVEAGGFGSYNKVQTPREVRMAFSRGGSVEDRRVFIEAVYKLWTSIDLVNLVTPEYVYLDCNVVNVRRTMAADHGIGLTTLDVTLQQVRQTAKLVYVSTAQPTGAKMVNDGAVQAQPTAITGGPR